MGVQLEIVHASTSREIDDVFAKFSIQRPDALFVSGESLFNSRRLQLALLTARHAIPATYTSRDYPISGGLMSYGADVTDAFRQVGRYVGRILKGARPADLPVVQSAKFELVINHQAARTLGLTVPPKLLATADAAPPPASGAIPTGTDGKRHADRLSVLEDHLIAMNFPR